jgi:hypothetical protein
MQRHESSMRSEELAPAHIRGPAPSSAPGSTSGPRSGPLDDPLPALQDQCERLQLLVADLLLKNHELRCEAARLRGEKGDSAAERHHPSLQVDRNFADA